VSPSPTIGRVKQFAQGDPADAILYIQQGRIKVSVVSEIGKEAVVAFLGAGDFIGTYRLALKPMCRV